MQVDRSPEGCSEICDLGLDAVYNKFMEIAATQKGRSSDACMRNLAALSALTIGNNDNAVAVASHGMPFFNTLQLMTKESLSCEGQKGSLMALLSVCECYFLSSSGSKTKECIIKSGMVDLLADVMRKHGSHPCVVLQISWLSRNMVIRIRCDRFLCESP